MAPGFEPADITGPFNFQRPDRNVHQNKPGNTTKVFGPSLR